MAKTKHDRVCADCIHFHACQSWTSGILDDTDAGPCRNYETVVDSNAYYLGQIDADRRNRAIDPVPDENATDRYGNPLIQCPNCDYVLAGSERYCPYCGQRLAKED